MKRKISAFFPELCLAALFAAFAFLFACAPMPRAEAERAAAALTRAREQELAGQRTQIRDELLARQEETPPSQGLSAPYWESRRTLPDPALRPPPRFRQEPEDIAEAEFLPADPFIVAALPQAASGIVDAPVGADEPDVSALDERRIEQVPVPAEDVIQAATLEPVPAEDVEEAVAASSVLEEDSPEAAALAATSVESVMEAAVPEPALSEQEQYRAALDDFLKRRYEEAYASLKLLADAYPASSRMDQIQYWQGESLYALRAYAEADRYFAAVEERSPASIKLPDALLMMVQCRLKLGRHAEVAAPVQRLEKEFPRSRQFRIAQRLTRASR